MTEDTVPSDAHLTSIAEKVVLVLVETSDPGNIGGSARAMKTMGFGQLRLVNPEHFPHPKAVWRAKNAANVIEQAQVYASLTEAVADCQLVMATSARSRSLPWPRMTAREAASLVLQAAQPSSAQRVALVFGRERSGLTNDELQQCHRHITIPASADYSVLNLSHAVQVLCYEIFCHCQENSNNTNIDNHFGIQWDQPLAKQSEVQAMLAELEKTLATTQFYNPDNPDKLIPRLHRMFLRTGLDRMEVNIWRGIIRHFNTFYRQKVHEQD